MKRIAIIFLLLATQVFAADDSVSYAGLPDNAYLDGGDSKIAVILLHGRGKHPRWRVVNPLRKEIHTALGWHTLSLQMPNDDVPFEKYADFFPDAYSRIQAAIKFLREEKGVTTIYLVGHSMGSRMGSAFVATHPDAGISGFIGVGMREGSTGVLDPKRHLKKIQAPILDIYGQADAKDVAGAKSRKKLVNPPRYIQVGIAGANHKFIDHEGELSAEVISWLTKQGNL